MAHDSTQIINELKRSRAEFEEETWRPDLDLDSLRDSVPGSKRAMLANASKLFLELQVRFANVLPLLEPLVAPLPAPLWLTPP